MRNDFVNTLGGLFLGTFIVAWLVFDWTVWLPLALLSYGFSHGVQTHRRRANQARLHPERPA